MDHQQVKTGKTLWHYQRLDPLRSPPMVPAAVPEGDSCGVEDEITYWVRYRKWSYEGGVFPFLSFFIF